MGTMEGNEADHRAQRDWELEETIMSIQNAIINSPEIEVTSDVQAGSFKLELTSSLRVHAKVPANTFNPGDMIPVARNVNERVGEGRRSHLKFVGYTIEMHKAAGIGKEYFDKESQQFVQNCYFD